LIAPGSCGFHARVALRRIDVFVSSYSWICRRFAPAWRGSRARLSAPASRGGGSRRAGM
jgi:hypothetical protein